MGLSLQAISGNRYERLRPLPVAGFLYACPALSAWDFYMKNIDKLARYIVKNGGEDILIHTIPGTSNWIIGQKIGKDTWMLTLGNPMGSVIHHLGTVTDRQHLQLWDQLVRLEIENKTSQAPIAKELREALVKKF